MKYVDGVMCPVPTANKAAYKAYAMSVAEIFKAHGALTLVDCWGTDVPQGKLNSMHSAVISKPEETVVFAWITWPSKEVRDAAWEKLMQDPALSELPMPFDGSRMIFGGFEVLMEA